MHPPQDVHGWLLQVKSCPEGLNGMFPRSGSPAQTAWHISTGSSEVTGQLREDGGLAVIHPLPHSPLPTRSCILHKTTLRCHWILSLWASEEAKETFRDVVVTGADEAGRRRSDMLLPHSVATGPLWYPESSRKGRSLLDEFRFLS